MKPVLFITLLTCCCFRITPAQTGIQQARWLLGSWQQQAGKRIQTEEWKQLNDSTFAGRSYWLKGTDTVLLEQTTIVWRNRRLYYIPVVQGQNNEQPVQFTQAGITAGKLIFENKTHDFPQQISYQLINPDSAVAEISGTLKGIYQTRSFPMRRLP
ncbi:hypothetical protein HNQ91_003632 [Filimonas zeae]|uniref:DUF6265 domain-containing protein n=1 Tax=Filimonas zeae TaxID=1737353 RepID=A0A917IZE6_9BACT|nr:DUF6265 family protein [Filimonas zeae]MDR6340567.1 hypothetical protein [Filimonas zeae]GGH73338.1 hypothetical protein GCM10011379_34740 [Filimonas zeae]